LNRRDLVENVVQSVEFAVQDSEQRVRGEFGGEDMSTWVHAPLSLATGFTIPFIEISVHIRGGIGIEPSQKFSPTRNCTLEIGTDLLIPDVGAMFATHYADAKTGGIFFM
jgi:hypothetical protein